MGIRRGEITTKIISDTDRDWETCIGPICPLNNDNLSDLSLLPI